MSQRRRRPSLRALLSWPGILIPVVVILAAAAAGTWLGTRPASDAQQYQLVPVGRTTLRQTLSATGTIEPQTTGTLTFSAPGTVTAVDVAVGQHVTKGQTLATMNSPTLQEQVAQAEESLDSDESRLAQDSAAGASSAQIAADQATVSSDQAQVASAEQALSGATLVSPVSGIVTTVGYTAGEQVTGSGGADGGGSGGDGGGSGGTAGGGGDSSDSGGGDSSAAGSAGAITVASSSDVVNASVNASVIDEIKAGDPAVVTPEGGGAPVTAAVGSIGLTADTSTGVATFGVVIDVTGSTSGLYAGASATVSIVYRQVAGALVVPSAAVLPRPGGDSIVVVMTAGRQVTRRVTTGITSGGLTQITSGLRPGEKVVVTTVRLGGASGGGRGGGGGGGGSGGGGPVFIGPGGGKVIQIGGG